MHTRTYLRSTSGLDGTPPGVFTLTGSDLVPSPFLVRAATYKYHQLKILGQTVKFHQEQKIFSAHLNLVLGVRLQPGHVEGRHFRLARVEPERLAVILMDSVLEKRWHMIPLKQSYRFLWLNVDLVGADDAVLVLVHRRSPPHQDGRGVERFSTDIPRLSRDWKSLLNLSSERRKHDNRQHVGTALAESYAQQISETWTEEGKLFPVKSFLDLPDT